MVISLIHWLEALHLADAYSHLYHFKLWPEMMPEYTMHVIVGVLTIYFIWKQWPIVFHKLGRFCYAVSWSLRKTGKALYYVRDLPAKAKASIKRLCGSDSSNK